MRYEIVHRFIEIPIRPGRFLFSPIRHAYFCIISIRDLTTRRRRRRSQTGDVARPLGGKYELAHREMEDQKIQERDRLKVMLQLTLQVRKCRHYIFAGLSRLHLVGFRALTIA